MLLENVLFTAHIALLLGRVLDITEGGAVLLQVVLLLERVLCYCVRCSMLLKRCCVIGNGAICYWRRCCVIGEGTLCY